MPLNLPQDRTDPAELQAFLIRWSAALADTLARSLTDRGGRFTAAAVHRSREETTARLREIAPPEDGIIEPSLVATARYTDHVAVNVTDSADGRTAAAILFVCPDHKADSDAALSFAVRTAALLDDGAGVVIVDLVPGPATWATHLNSLVAVIPASRRPRGGECPVLAVQPTAPDGIERFLAWLHAVSPGATLPAVVLPVRGAGLIPLDLEATYTAGHG